MAAAPRTAILELPRPAAMTRCECAGIAFGEIARRIREDGITLAECGRRTGCGQTCTACLSDLEAFLDAGVR
jgi:NAD(P)H-nitrite reductase large subunit